jgi:hypothetical protein
MDLTPVFAIRFMKLAPSRITASNQQCVFFAALQQSSKANPTTGFDQSEIPPVDGAIDPLYRITFASNNRGLFGI